MYIVHNTQTVPWVITQLFRSTLHVTTPPSLPEQGSFMQSKKCFSNLWQHVISMSPPPPIISGSHDRPVLKPAERPEFFLQPFELTNYKVF